MSNFFFMTTLKKILMYLTISFFCLLVPDMTVQAQNKLGAHFGSVIPMVTVNKDETTNLSDNFSIGFPAGVTIKKTDKFAFDLEIVPFIDEHFVTLLFHPGVLVGLGNSLTFGTRAAFEVNQNSYGFTPLLNKSFPIDNNYVGFAELVLPVRFVEDNTASKTTSFTVALHFGIGF